MNLNVDLRKFRDFSSAAILGGGSTDIATFSDGKIVSLSDNRVGGNAACSVGKRSDDAKLRNDVTRAALICALLREFTFGDIDSEEAINNIERNADGGNWNISDDVLNAIADKLGSGNSGISKKDFNCGKPLTARRILKIVAAALKVRALPTGYFKNGQNPLNQAVVVNGPVNDKPAVDSCLNANTYLDKCKKATDIDSFLANASMAFALCAKERLEEMVKTIARSSNEKYGLEPIPKTIIEYAEKVDKKDADWDGFSKLRGMMVSNSILADLCNGKKLTEDCVIREAPIPKAGVDKIKEYANKTAKKNFVKQFADRQFEPSGADPFENDNTIEGYVYKIIKGQDETFNKETGGNNLKEVVKDKKFIKIGDVKKRYKAKGVFDYKQFTRDLINEFKIGGTVQKASLAKFLVLSHKDVMDAARSAAVYRHDGTDDVPENTMGVIPLAGSVENPKKVTPHLNISQNDGVITVRFSEEVAGKGWDRSSADSEYHHRVDDHDYYDYTKYDPRYQMGGIHHNIKVSFSLSNNKDDGIEVLSATASATYLAVGHEF